MQYRELGRTGLRTSVIGLGGIGAMGKYGPVSADSFARTMAEASALGINFLDTAPSYGDSEVVFGHFLKDHRADWIVCTKVGACGSGRKAAIPDPDAIRSQLERSLARLNVAHVDLLLIHSIDQYGCGAEALRNVEANGLLDAMRRLRDEGKARFLGASGQLGELVPAVASGKLAVALTYNCFNLLVRDAAATLLPAAAEHGVGVVLGGAFYQGLLSGLADRLVAEKHRWFERQDPGFCQTESLLRRVEALTALVGGDLPALRRLALRFALSDPRIAVVVSGMRCVEEVVENAAAVAAGPLDAAERQRIDQELARVPGAEPRWPACPATAECRA